MYAHTHTNVLSHRLEAEKRRQAELERQNRRSAEIQRERERQLAKLAEQREAELREEERRRKEEWARRRRVELEGMREWEMKALRALQSQHSNLENELQQLVYTLCVCVALCISRVLELKSAWNLHILAKQAHFP